MEMRSSLSVQLCVEFRSFIVQTHTQTNKLLYPIDKTKRKQFLPTQIQSVIIEINLAFDKPERLTIKV